jgi:hypothetical protein
LAAAIMAACEPRKARPPCSLAALQMHNTWDPGCDLVYCSADIMRTSERSELTQVLHR